MSLSGNTTPAPEMEGPADNWTEMERNLPQVPQEDTEMVEVTGPTVTNHNSAPSLSRKEILVKLQAEVDALDEKIIMVYSKESSSEMDEKLCLQWANQIESKQKVMATLNSVRDNKVSKKGKGTADSKWANAPSGNKGLTLNRNDLPCFQLVGRTYPQFKGKKIYKSVEEHISAFEEVVASANHGLDENWKVYLPIAFPDELKAWMRNELFTCQSWIEAKKFGNAQLRILATKELMAMTMYNDETISDFDNRFMQALENTDYSSDDRIIADFYFIALPLHWQTHVMTVIGAQKKENEAWTAAELFQITFNIFTDKRPELGNPTERKGSSPVKRSLDNDAEGSKPYKKRVNSTALMYCSYHGDNNSHNSSECQNLVENKAESSQPAVRSRLHNRSYRSKAGVPCRQNCGNNWTPGHTCEAYYKKHPGKRPENQTVLAVTANNKGKKAVRDDRFENESYECKIDTGKGELNFVESELRISKDSKKSHETTAEP
ncbi:hypothetical protein MFLAVUS_011331 [Mucor flavus]|uniref:Gag protein n=1 Tax=Mucor flavus TaxID=439312 RepID=A0ABP9ZF77_9FUNG